MTDPTVAVRLGTRHGLTPAQLVRMGTADVDGHVTELERAGWDGPVPIEATPDIADRY